MPGTPRLYRQFLVPRKFTPLVSAVIFGRWVHRLDGVQVLQSRGGSDYRADLCCHLREGIGRIESQ